MEFRRVLFRSDEATSPSVLPAKPAPATASYTTRAHDSLWKIAETHIGDGTRFTDIADLNPDLFPDGPEFLTTGTVLQLPARDEIGTAPLRAWTCKYE